MFDTNGDGFITKEELRDGLEAIGQKFTEEQINAMFKDADSNGDGHIDYAEFKGIM